MLVQRLGLLNTVWPLLLPCLHDKALYPLTLFLREVLTADQTDPSTVTDPELQAQLAHKRRYDRLGEGLAWFAAIPSRMVFSEKLAGFIIVLTAYRDREIAEKAVNMDIMGYIVKPVDEDTLIPAIKIAQRPCQRDYYGTQKSDRERSIFLYSQTGHGQGKAHGGDSKNALESIWRVKGLRKQEAGGENA